MLERQVRGTVENERRWLLFGVVQMAKLLERLVKYRRKRIFFIFLFNFIFSFSTETGEI